MEKKGIVLTGREAYEVFLKWGGEGAFTRLTEMVAGVGVEESFQNIKEAYEAKGHTVEPEFVQSLKNAYEYYLLNSKNN